MRLHQKFLSSPARRMSLAPGGGVLPAWSRYKGAPPNKAMKADNLQAGFSELGEYSESRKPGCKLRLILALEAKRAWNSRSAAIGDIAYFFTHRCLIKRTGYLITPLHWKLRTWKAPCKSIMLLSGNPLSCYSSKSRMNGKDGRVKNLGVR